MMQKKNQDKIILKVRFSVLRGNCSKKKHVGSLGVLRLTGKRGDQQKGRDLLEVCSKDLVQQ